MSQQCQLAQPFAIAVAGVAGSGKSTLGRALARSLRVAVLDLDTLTNPVLEHLPDGLLGDHWLASPHAAAIRDGRYAALRATAREVIEASGGVVLVAPFTAELDGGPAWEALLHAVEPAVLRVVQIVGDPALLAARRARRAESRDQHRAPDVNPSRPAAVPVLEVDAGLTTDQQLRLLWPALG